MPIRVNLFIKMVAILFSIISITLFFYGISYRKDIRVITNQIKTSDLNHLDFLTEQMDNNINQLAGSIYTLQHDPTVRDYEQIQKLDHLIDPSQTILTVLEKLSLQTGSSTWENRILIYNLQKKETLSSDSALAFDTSVLQRVLPEGWVYVSPGTANGQNGEFRLLLSDPSDYREMPELANMILEVRFPTANIEKMFNSYQSQNTGNTFLYHERLGFIQPSNSDELVARSIAESISNASDFTELSTVVKLKNDSYLVSAVRSSTLGWYVIHYSSIEQILQPIQSNRYSFLIASAVLLIMSLLFSLLLFRQVQRPVSLLLRALNRMKEGQWSTRIHMKTNNEFSRLNEEFNEMAATIQSLIERVYLEQLSTKDAYLKQLQSQINPHFLYNCLFFMKSKASIGDTESVEAMALNLGEYYRYITKMDHSLTTIEEEMKLLENYLAIQNLRKQRIQYEIHMPAEIMDEPIPRLLIQPLVENSIIHGVEKKNGLGLIRIIGVRNPSALIISVEDNGIRMDEGRIAEMYTQLTASLREDRGCGLWNVQQRLKLQFGELSNIHLSASELGGLKISLYIQQKEAEHAANFTR
ncbi:sensor histidine kinase [Paenibacillus wynnii]|uniref:sensor histidine kinase n=1 Tax=Paenibacillus wynnii TaxID=268407 RepID=UPI00278DA2E9|nr:sensor histidine kinase [Paenibacillus wynnii]MDQ0192001.1 two-component system sensor histidine kinase YesM [Paenibacillus wynnii]